MSNPTLHKCVPSCCRRLCSLFVCIVVVFAFVAVAACGDDADGEQEQWTDELNGASYVGVLKDDVLYAEQEGVWAANVVADPRRDLYHTTYRFECVNLDRKGYTDGDVVPFRVLRAKKSTDSGRYDAVVDVESMPRDEHYTFNLLPNKGEKVLMYAIFPVDGSMVDKERELLERDAEAARNGDHCYYTYLHEVSQWQGVYTSTEYCQPDGEPVAVVLPEVLVRMRGNVVPLALLDKYVLTLKKATPRYYVLSCKASNDEQVLNISEAIAKENDVIWAEPNRISYVSLHQ